MSEEIDFLGELESTVTEKGSGKSATLFYDVESATFYILIADIKYYIADEYVSTQGVKTIYRRAGLDYSSFHEPAKDWGKKVREIAVPEELARSIDRSWARYKPGLKVKYVLKNTNVIIL